MDIPTGYISINSANSLSFLIKDYLRDHFDLVVDVKIKVVNKRTYWVIDVPIDSVDYSFLLEEFSILKTFIEYYYVGNTPLDEHVCANIDTRIFDRYICADRIFDSTGEKAKLVEDGAHYLTSTQEVDNSYLRKISAHNILFLKTGIIFFSEMKLPICLDEDYQIFLRNPKKWDNDHKNS